MPMRCLDSRRLTGPNLLWDRPGAVIDVDFENDDPDEAIDSWQRQIRRMLDAVLDQLEGETVVH